MRSRANDFTYADSLFFAAIKEASHSTACRRSFSTSLSIPAAPVAERNRMSWNARKRRIILESMQSRLRAPEECLKQEQKLQTRGNLRTSFFQHNVGHSSHLPDQFFSDVARLRWAARRPLVEDNDNMRALASSLRPTPPAWTTNAKVSDAATEIRSLMEAHLSPAKDGASEVLESTLTKQNYMDLVDLYFYSSQNRFQAENPDLSPTPIFVKDPGMELSADLSLPVDSADESAKEQLYSVNHETLLGRVRRQEKQDLLEMDTFLTLLLDERSSDQRLFDAYQQFPQPGVSNLSDGCIRVFLQRMAVPLHKSEAAKIRYLSLMDDMQKAKLPITAGEWTSAIYLASRSFSKVFEKDVVSAWQLWRHTEEEAGVLAGNVTFNVLFDVAVRAGKFTLAETVLQKMTDRGLRLNRLGRVSLIYYYGLRRDGDSVRKAYRDFIEAGEIVDIYVLNCVMASLINAQEPMAAEQIYERIKSMQENYLVAKTVDGEDGLFRKYPPPGGSKIDGQMAANQLGRILSKAPGLLKDMPEIHAHLQNQMPLRPDQVTFRTLLKHHSTTSGNLDRLTVLLSDKVQLMGLPISVIDFQLLFKGFALHGAKQSEDNPWTKERLDIVWDTCFDAIKSVPSPGGFGLPPTEDIDSRMSQDATQWQNSPQDNVSVVVTPKKRTMWQKFIRDVGHDPGQYATNIDNEDTPNNKLPSGEDTPFESPFFPRSTPNDEDYTPPRPESYTTPPTTTTPPKSRPPPSGIYPTRPMLTWLLRAYQRVTSDRTRVEDVWNKVRRSGYRPRDDMERAAIVAVLRGCLRECDRFAATHGFAARGSGEFVGGEGSGNEGSGEGVGSKAGARAGGVRRKWK